MGVEFAHLLIPQDNTSRPDAEAIAGLVEQWRAQAYVPRPGSYGHAALGYEPGDRPASLPTWGFSLKLGDGAFVESEDAGLIRPLRGLEEREFLLRFPVVGPAASGLSFAFEHSEPDGAYYDIDVLASEDFIEYIDERIEPVSDVCLCGEHLGYWVGTEDIFCCRRIRRFCPRCERPFRPQEQTVNSASPFTGEITPLRGGACFRFAIRIQAGKGLNPVPRIDGHLPRAAPAFLDLCQRALGQPLYEVGYLY